ncbi:hypothetical protein [uncultured Gimesia sp.]|uniref:hypothetical protein n=1 Tax=uncultured Gimesia sp. TaxID=1678688 RepID=UPI002628D47A|nr:hypothetical protein [uncultured Gimesia sp.]
MHRKRIFNQHRILLLLFCAATLSQQGCMVFREHFSLSSMWFDYNTLRAPALFFEKHDHFPYRARQVAFFHWQYGVTPGKDVRYERPDLWGGDQPYQVPNENVMNVSAIEGNIQPTVIPNGSMQVGPQMKLKPYRKRNPSGVEFIPPPPGAPPTPGVSSQPLAPPIPPPAP